ncbi:MAG: nuclear transport factor 2 family protein [Acidobacteriaceae bacterium]
MRITPLLLAASFLSMSCMTTSAFASDRSDVLAVVHHFDDAFNSGNTQAIVSTCTPDMVIIDDFPPHLWQGPHTCQHWLDALAALGVKDAITDGIVTMGAPWRVTITGDHAYVVVPTTYKYKMHGKPVVESGAVLTLALRKVASKWLIAGWAWAQH